MSTRQGRASARRRSLDEALEAGRAQLDEQTGLTPAGLQNFTVNRTSKHAVPAHPPRRHANFRPPATASYRSFGRGPVSRDDPPEQWKAAANLGNFTQGPRIRSVSSKQKPKFYGPVCVDCRPTVSDAVWIITVKVRIL
jgi:hypothetical protein